MKKIAKITLISTFTLSALSIAHADENTKKIKETKATFSNNFVVTPIQVICTAPGKPEKLTLSNKADVVLNVQSKLSVYEQKSVNGKLIEDDIDLTPEQKSKFIVSPPILGNIRGNAQQLMRLMPLSQDENKELVYRFTVKSLTPRDLNDTGPAFATAYAVPIFVLPKNVNESYKISYVEVNGKSYLKVMNDGNVHINFKDFSVEIPSGKNNNAHLAIEQRRILAGQSEFIEIPKATAKLLNAEKALHVNVVKGDLYDINKKNISKVVTVVKTA